jgi:hypothetical protein
LPSPSAPWTKSVTPSFGSFCKRGVDYHN